MLIEVRDLEVGLGCNEARDLNADFLLKVILFF